MTLPNHNRKCVTHGFEHNQRLRTTDGFYCEDCQTFFPKPGADVDADEMAMRCRGFISQAERQYKERWPNR